MKIYRFKSKTNNCSMNYALGKLCVCVCGRTLHLMTKWMAKPQLLTSMHRLLAHSYWHQPSAWKNCIGPVFRLDRTCHSFCLRVFSILHQIWMKNVHEKYHLPMKIDIWLIWLYIESCGRKLEKPIKRTPRIAEHCGRQNYDFPPQSIQYVNRKYFFTREIV